MNNWTAADFITYIYQIVADSDFETASKEVDLVKSQVAKLVAKHFDQHDYSYTASIKKIQEAEGLSLSNCIDVIKQLAPRFDFSKEVKADILTDLTTIATSDLTITPSERETIRFIKQVFMTVEMPLSW